MGRYEDSLKVRNDIDFYNFLRKNKGVKSIEHLNTAFLYHPTGLERASISTTQHIWKYGDRFYKLAHLYYKDPSYWWVIAWWNGKPTEADLVNGSVINIPISLEDTLMLLGAY